MYRDVFRVQCNSLFQTMRKPFHRITGQTGDQVHIDVVMTGRTCRRKTINNVLCRVAPANVV